MVDEVKSGATPLEGDGKRILLILGALSAFGPMAIDFYLPSFPTLARQFATDVEHVQLSLAAYFIGLAGGQLLYGPLADRFGRRLPLLIGVGLFTSLQEGFTQWLAQGIDRWTGEADQRQVVGRQHGLAEDAGEDGHGVDETGHDRVGHKAYQRAQLEQAGEDKRTAVTQDCC